MTSINKAFEKFRNEFSENIDKIIKEKENEIDKDVLELMQHMLKNTRIRIYEE